MAECKITEGEIDFRVPAAGIPCKTWYTIYGDISSGRRPPLVMLHAGPGVPHDYLIPISNSLVAKTGIPVVLYDQIGCGKSTHLAEKVGDTSFWSVDLFVAELENLLAKLGIHDAYHLLGHSWGGIIAATQAIRQPQGLQKLILSNTLADMRQWERSVNRLRAELPQDVQIVLSHHEEVGTEDSEEYMQAMSSFYDRHLCRIKPLPEDFEKSIRASTEDSTVAISMNGPSEFKTTGTLKDWTITDNLHRIIVPTLVINGKYDQASDEVVQPFLDRIPRVGWVKFARSSHSPQLEEPEEYLNSLTGFLVHD